MSAVWQVAVVQFQSVVQRIGEMGPYGIIWALSLMIVKIVAFFNLAFSLNLGNSNSVELKIRHAQTRSNTKYEMRLHEITNLAMGAGPASPVGQQAGPPDQHSNF